MIGNFIDYKLVAYNKFYSYLSRLKKHVLHFITWFIPKGGYYFILLTLEPCSEKTNFETSSFAFTYCRSLLDGLDNSCIQLSGDCLKPQWPFWSFLWPWLLLHMLTHLPQYYIKMCQWFLFKNWFRAVAVRSASADDTFGNCRYTIAHAHRASVTLCDREIKKWASSS